jgi:hypothetical protein
MQSICNYASISDRQQETWNIWIGGQGANQTPPLRALSCGPQATSTGHQVIRICTRPEGTGGSEVLALPLPCQGCPFGKKETLVDSEPHPISQNASGLMWRSPTFVMEKTWCRHALRSVQVGVMYPNRWHGCCLCKKVWTSLSNSVSVMQAVEISHILSKFPRNILAVGYSL